MTVRMDESKCIYFKEEDTKMSVQVENLEKNMAKLTIEVSAEELEKALRRLVPQAAATMAARTPALTYRGLSGDILTFETGTDANPDTTSDTIEAALSWLLLEMCRPGTAAGSPTSGVLVALGNTAGDCPGHRVSHWL